MEIKPKELCTIRIVEGSLTDKTCLAGLDSRTIQTFDDDASWGRLLEIKLPFEKIKDIQQYMIKHYEGPSPWYMDGFLANDRDTVICAFGADDGEGGKTFVFHRDDQTAFQKVMSYAISKGIPKGQVDFLDY